jgi:2-oxoglutarate dehydrogenase E2 component (dihydrolipoamide succinyltransferase)
VLAEIVQADGATVAAEQVIAKIDTEGKARGARPRQRPHRRAARRAAPAPPAVQVRTSRCRRPPRCMADNNCAAVGAGTGKDGRVTKGDVLGACAGGAKPPSRRWPRPPARRRRAAAGQRAGGRARPGPAPEQRVPMSRLRARVAERLLQSQSSNAILTTFNEVNMAPVMEMRKRFQEKFEKEHGVKIGFMSFFVKAAVHALKKYPVINASVDGNDIVYHGYFDIGIAWVRRAAWSCPSCATPTR